MLRFQKRFRHTLALLPLVVVVLAFTAWVGAAPVAGSGPWFVSPAGNDANDCQTFATACRTIGAAVGKAGAGDTIIIASGVYTEGLTLGKNLTLIGFGADATIINQGSINVSGATVQIFDLALTNGYSGDKAPFVNNGGNVSLNYTAILTNHGNHGGGIWNYLGGLTLDHTTVAANETIHNGAGIYNYQGNVTVSNSNIVSNTACNARCTWFAYNTASNQPATGWLSSGGGIYSYGSLTVTDSTISGNTVQDGGGGIDSAGPAIVTNVTFSGNQSTYRTGGGISGGVLTLTNVTLTNNSAPNGGTLVGSPATTWLKNTIIANTVAGSNCDGSVISLGHNLSSDSSCTLNASGDLTNTNPLLGPLQNNGGPTPTHALLPGSPAINHGDNLGCPATDQRGIARPQGGTCDIGAYEYVFSDTLFLPLVAR